MYIKETCVDSESLTSDHRSTLLINKSIATAYLVEQYVYHFLYVWIVHSTCQRTLFNNSQHKSSARSNVYFIRSTSCRLKIAQ